MGDDYNITDKIVAIDRGENLNAAALPPRAAAEQSADAYIDGMAALGWLPILVVHADGRTSMFERHPEGSDRACIEDGHKVSARWMATPGQRDAVKRALRARGLIRYR